MLYDVESDQAYFAPTNNAEYQPYKIKSIIDRVGGGDSFSAGLIFALHDAEYEDQSAISFAVASSCLAHSIRGDINYSSRKEVESLMNGSGTGRVIR